MQTSRVISVVLLSLGAACSGAPPEPAPAPLPPGLFVDATSDAGLGDFRHERGASGLFWMPETYGAGASFVDVDGDGWPDVAAVSGGVWEGEGPPAIRLYRNTKDGRFVDITREAGLDRYRAVGFGVVAADYDNDGDVDLYLTALGPNLLLRNDAGRFTEVAAEAGVAGDAWSTAALFFDPDRDGLLDLYVGQYVDWTPAKDRFCTSDGTQKDYCMPHAYEGVGARFYRNRGDGTLADHTQAAGLEGNPGKTLGVAEYDLNADGWPDFVVANDTHRNLVYLNRGDGTFDEVGLRTGIAFDTNGRARAGMGIDIGVLDETGKPSILIGNFSDEMVGLYREVDAGIYRDRAPEAGLGLTTLPVLTFGVTLFDADLDTDLDVLLANGHILEQVDRLQQGMTYRQPAHLYVNQGDGSFLRDVAGLPATPLVARGAAYGDYDRDGDLDLLLTENGGAMHLWQNQTNPAGRQDLHTLRLYLQGSTGNRDGIGARVEAILPGGVRLERRVRTGGSYLSQSELPLTLGLGSASRVDTLRIYWPSGQVDLFTDVPAGSAFRAVEGAIELDSPSPL